MKISQELLEDIKSYSPDDSILKSIDDCFKRESKALDEFIEYSVRQKALPKVRGRITKLALWWRNIKLQIHLTDSPLKKRWVMTQFGKPINQVYFQINIRT